MMTDFRADEIDGCSACGAATLWARATLAASKTLAYSSEIPATTSSAAGGGGLGTFSLRP